MCSSIRDCKTSEFVFIETVFINIIQHPTTPKFAVKPCDIDVFAKASAIRPTTPKHPMGLPLGVSRLDRIWCCRTISLMNDCHARPGYAYVGMLAMPPASPGRR